MNDTRILRTVPTIGAALAALLWISPAGAGSLDLPTAGPISTGTGLFDFLPDDGELSAFGIALAGGPADGLEAAIFFDPEATLTSLVDLGGRIVPIVEAGATTRLIELRTDPFGTLRSGALITIDLGLPPSGEDALAALITGGAAEYQGAVTLQGIVPIPLPGSAPMTALSVLVLAGLHCRRGGAKSSI